MSSKVSSREVKPFVGYVETTVNALRLIHAARHGLIPRITRRLNDAERKSMIKSGAVFVFGVEESGIKRWTDGLLWSPSRIVGNFLVYREINERANSRGQHRRSYPIEDTTIAKLQHQRVTGYAALAQVGEKETFKDDGLIKKTITVTVEGTDLHLISYYTAEDIRSGKLRRPSGRPEIMALDMPPHLFRLTNFRNPPKVEIGPDGKSRLACEADDLEPAVKIEDSPSNATPFADRSHDRTPGIQMIAPQADVPSLRVPSESSYYGNGGDGRWSQYDSTRTSSSNERRHEYLWSMSESSSSAVAYPSTYPGSDPGGRNRGDGVFTAPLLAPESSESWWLSSSQQQRGNQPRGPHNLYDMSVELVDRARSRNLDNMTVEPGGRRGEYTFSGGYSQIPGNLDSGAAQRIGGWGLVSATETEGDRFRRSAGNNSYYNSSMQPSAPLVDRYGAGTQGYEELTYPAMWSNSSDSSSESQSPQAIYPPGSDFSYFTPNGQYIAEGYQER